MILGVLMQFQPLTSYAAASVMWTFTIVGLALLAWDLKIDRRWVIAAVLMVSLLSARSYALYYVEYDICMAAPNWFYLIYGCWWP